MMRLVLRYLQSRHGVTEQEVVVKFRRMWFGTYDRDRTGFEHVFVGEVAWGNVKGYHNWVTFFLAEACPNVNYYGFYNYTSDCLTLQFAESLPFTDGRQRTMAETEIKLKKIGGFWLGSTPVADLVIATVLALTNTTRLTINGAGYEICTYWDNGRILTIYPRIL